MYALIYVAEDKVHALNPTYLGLFEGFSTIIRQLGDNAVKRGFLRTTSGF